MKITKASLATMHKKLIDKMRIVHRCECLWDHVMNQVSACMRRTSWFNRHHRQWICRTSSPTRHRQATTTAPRWAHHTMSVL